MLIEWIDASRLSDGWMDYCDIPNAYQHKCVSVGFAVSRTKSGVVLVPTIGDTEHPENWHTYGGMMIPTGNIIFEKRLR